MGVVLQQSLQKEYPNGQDDYKVMFNFISHHGNAN